MSGLVKGKNWVDVVCRAFGTFARRQRRRRAIRGILGGGVSLMLCLSMVVQPTRADYLWLTG